MQPSPTHPPRFQPASDRSLLVYFDQKIALDVHQRVRKLLRLLEREPVVGIRNLNPAYCSILVNFDALILNHGELESILLGISTGSMRYRSQIRESWKFLRAMAENLARTSMR